MEFKNAHDSRYSGNIYIVTVNYKSSQALEELIHSIEHLSYDKSKLTLLVVDSSNDYEEKLQNNIKTHLIKLPRNLGFAHAANIGIKNAITKSKHKNDYIWLLNPDVILEKDSLTQALENITPQSIHGSAVTNDGFSADAIMWGAGGYISEDLDVHMKYTGEARNTLPTSSFACDYVPGCSMLFHMSIPETYGYLPEEYFLYFEETDWCLSLKQQGVSFFINPKSVMQHHSPNEKMQAPFRVYFFNRNETYFKIKHEKNTFKKAYKILCLLKKFIQLAHLNIKNTDKSLAATFKAHLYAQIDAMYMLIFKNKDSLHSLSLKRLKSFK